MSNGKCKGKEIRAQRAVCAGVCIYIPAYVHAPAASDAPSEEVAVAGWHLLADSEQGK